MHREPDLAMMHLLKRHPWAVTAHFDWVLALVFAVPKETAQALMLPGLEADLYGDTGFVAAAFVQTRKLRPSWLPPFMAQDFFLAGMRVFARGRLPDGRNVRGLRILGSATDSWRMKIADSLLSHYQYEKIKITTRRSEPHLEMSAWDSKGALSIKFLADLTPTDHPPPGSPFPDLKAARRFAGPMPFTFTYEEETDSLIVVEGARQSWVPRPVQVEIETLRFFTGPPFAAPGCLPRLANAFYIEKVDYHWKPGVLVPAHLSLSKPQ